jgi:hypothetical protein
LESLRWADAYGQFSLRNNQSIPALAVRGAGDRI